jgi:hypothetical protein
MSANFGLVHRSEDSISYSITNSGTANWNADQAASGL